MGELGLTAAPLPESVGGAGFSYLGWTLVMEELGAVDMSMAVSLSVHILSQYPVVTWGTPEQHARWLPAMLSGEALGAFALTEPHAGSDAAAIRTRAERVGPADAPDGYRLTGTKIWISNAPEAERYLVFATLDPALGAKGITAFLVEKGTPGFRFGAHERKMGIRPARPPSSSSMAPRCRSRTASAPRARAIRSRCRRSGRAGSRSRRRASGSPGRAGGGGALPRAAPGVRGAARRAAGPALHARRDGPRGRGRAGRHPGGGPGQGSGRAARGGLSIAKWTASDAAMRVATDAVQLFGASGYSRETGIERLMRDAKGAQIYEGTNQIHRLIVADGLLRGRLGHLTWRRPWHPARRRTAVTIGR